MAIEDVWVLAGHPQRHEGQEPDWDAVVAAFNAVRGEHCRRVVTTARGWRELWHLDGPDRNVRNEVLRGRDTYDYTYVDWLYGPTALTLDQEPPMFPRPPARRAAAGEPIH